MLENTKNSFLKMIILIVSFLLLSCSQKKSGVIEETLGLCDSTINYNTEFNRNRFEKFIYGDFEIFKVFEGRLNSEDTIKDVILVLKFVNEIEHIKTDTDPIRPLLILIKQINGNYLLSCKSDSAIISPLLGGTLGDPFKGITFDSIGLFTIHHLSGSFERCETKETFSFNTKDKEWVLTSRNIRCFVPFENDSIIYSNHLTVKDFGKVMLSEYSVYKEFP